MEKFYKNTNKIKNSYLKNEGISEWKTRINTRKLNWHVSTITYVFINQKRISLCELTERWRHMKVSITWRHLSVHSHRFILYWLGKASVIVKMCQLSFRVFTCAFHPEFSSFFGKSFLFLPLFFCHPYLGTFPFHVEKFYISRKNMYE